MSTYRFEALLAPRTIAIVGFGRSALGLAVAGNLAKAGFGGSVHLVGETGLPTLDDLPVTPDLVVIVAEAPAVEGWVDKAGLRGAAVAVILTSDMPADLCEAVRNRARRWGMRLLGPNSMGLMVPRAALDASLFAGTPKAGDLALISQSGTVAAGIVAWAAHRDVGFSAILSLGTACDIDIADCLDHFAADIHTRAILLSLNVIPNARKFMSAARAAARAKPVLVLRTGRHEAPLRHTVTHTGALARPDAVYEAAFRRAGLLSVDGLDAMFSAAETLGRQRPFPGQRLAILGNGEGIGALAADRLADRGGTLAATGAGGNPADLGVEADALAYAGALAPLLADPANDAVLAIHVPTARSDSAGVASAIADTVSAARRKGGRRKPVFAVTVGDDGEAGAVLAAAGIPRFATDADAVEGFMHLVRYREAQDDLMRTPDSLPREFSPDVEAARAIVATALEAGETWLDPLAVAGLLTAYRIDSVPLTLAPDIDAAAAAAWPIIAEGSAVALKVVSPDIVHKSDVGGVRLDLTSEADVRAAAADILTRSRRQRPDARIMGFAVQPMIRKGKRRELIAGLAEDPVFGPVVVFGRGGVAVEVIDDRALSLPPLDLRLASELIDRTRVARRLAAYRDVPAVDRRALGLVLVKLAQLSADLPEVRELDINPLLADANGVLALDARVMIGPAPERRGGTHNPRFAIRPYPVEWERNLVLKREKITVRPVRPEDEGLFKTFFEQVSAEDLRLRFFMPVRDFNHAFLARLTQLDYARAIAFVAIEAETASMLGAVRLHADANHESGEYAILIRSDRKGTGLGFALMQLMIDWARAEGLQRIEGTVLRENRAMLAVCRRLGFAAQPDKDDGTVMKVSLALSGM
ncbi:bifunctional acetate--CoA ligase family protein/GNAT family N-acetyltransferase [Methylobacterium sp. 77]|uniref:bifunctional acetate--CoA ligase family protein/GNAT family N-acetyltransferase n=1 Tax=Methylobacterium sp. 77 TaxID=1101192 RepID=UPI00037878DF|nr:bifunctional acetate--CoA ligase family protein/GNAT family N-acetyltransferase [Methylobacterium sp. 77]